MPTLDLVVSLPAELTRELPRPLGNVVAIQVPASLDPYHQQQLRDALAGDLQTGTQALLQRLAAKDAELPTAFAAGITDLQHSLEQAAARWLDQWNTPDRALDELPTDVAALLDRADAAFREVNQLNASAPTLPELDRQLGQLSHILESILDCLPPAGGAASARREALVQQLLKTIERGHRLSESLRARG